MFGNKIPVEEGSGPGYYITTIDYYIDGLVLNEDSKNALLHSLEKYCTHFNQKRELYDDYLREQAKIKKKK